MAATRDLLGEIAAIKSRRQHSFAFLELEIRLKAIESAFDKAGQEDTEILRYFPVAIVAAMESYFRSSMQQLIDFGEPFLSNAADLAKQIRIDFDLLKAIDGRAISIGELIAHSLKLSRVEHLNSVVSSIIGNSFSHSIETATDRWEEVVNGKPGVLLLPKAKDAFRGVARTFEIRHIVCHEAAVGFVTDRGEIETCLNHCFALLMASERFFTEIANPGAPLTQTDMNISAGVALAEKETELKVLLETMRAEVSSDALPAFDRAQTLWEEFCGSWVAFLVGDLEHGGSIWPLEYASAKGIEVIRRINQLRFSHETGKI